ncbi:MAG: PD-(D/E)XK nuclease family protein, partial [Bacteroidales bacterium]
MQTFLNAVAQDLVQKNIDFSTTAIVFPNKRASLFFNRELFAVLQKPFWSPNFLTINELFAKESSSQICEPFMLNYILYKVYRTHIVNVNSKLDESFEQFYFWGQMLLRDFDDLDKNLVDSHQLFINLQQIKELDNPLEYLSKEQIDLIQKYFQNFGSHKQSEMQKIFMNIWHVLGAIYTDFKLALTKQNLAYEGMLARATIENYKENGVTKTNYTHYVFVGFNRLDQSEKELFSLLKNAKKALFYWDYDQEYLRIENHEAAEFIKQNLHLFGNELSDPALFHNLEAKGEKQPKNIKFISAPSENAQARYADTWLKAQQKEDRQSANTAIVLCNEKLLLSVLSSVENLDKANLTMGFPVQNTPIASLINTWVKLQIGGYKWANVIALIEHPFVLPLFKNQEVKRFKMQHSLFPSPESIYGTDTKLQTIFKACTQPLEMLKQLQEIILLVVRELGLQENYNQENSNYTYNNLFIEAAYRAMTQLNLIYDLAQSKSIELSHLTLQRLLNSVLSVLNVPFKGEPVLGTQIMGILETRNLDFKNIVMLSVNEGMLPKTEGEASFIPYNFRKAFGMTTLDHRNAVYAYCFFRVLQRAENISLVYNTSTQGMNRGEMSRFMLQLLIEHHLPIKQYYLSSENVIVKNREPIGIQSSPAIVAYLKNKYSLKGVDPHPNVQGEIIRSFSPSALNAFIDCKLRFYLRYVANLQLPKDMSERVDNAVFGELFHFAAELLYRQIGKQLELEKTDWKPTEFKPISEEFRVQKNDFAIFANEKA